MRIYRNTFPNWKTNSNLLNVSGCRISKSMCPAGDNGKTRKLLEIDKKMIRILLGIPKGHAAIGSFTYKFVLPHQDYCRSCQDIEQTELLRRILC